MAKSTPIIGDPKADEKIKAKEQIVNKLKKLKYYL